MSTNNLETFLPKFDTNTKHAIVLSNYPDPDSIVSSIFLKLYFSKFNLTLDILNFSDISHQETKAMMKLLKLESYLVNEKDKNILNSYSHVWFVDGHGTENYVKFEKFKNLTIVGIIDHHPKSYEIDTDFEIIDLDAGSTATIIIDYLLSKNMEFYNNLKNFNDLATGLLYAIRSDTMRGRYMRQKDYIMATKIREYANIDLLNSIENESFSQETIKSFGKAINNIVYMSSDFLVTDVGILKPDNRDCLPQSAELLVKMDGINTSLVWALIVDENNMPLELNGSFRTLSNKIDTNNFLIKAFGIDETTGKPYGGGREYMGGLKIPIQGYFNKIISNDSIIKLLELSKTKIIEDLEKYFS